MNVSKFKNCIHNVCDLIAQHNVINEKQSVKSFKRPFQQQCAYVINKHSILNPTHDMDYIY